MVRCESTLTFTCLSTLTIKKVEFSTMPALPKCDFFHNASHYLNTCLKTAMFLLTPPQQRGGCGFASDHSFGLFGVRNVGRLWEDDCGKNTEFFLSNTFSLEDRRLQPHVSAKLFTPIGVGRSIDTHTQNMCFHLRVSNWSTIMVLFGGKIQAWSAVDLFLGLPL